jgi:hypothetical protein
VANLTFNRVVIFTIIGILLCLPANNVDGFPNGVGDVGSEGCLCHGEANSGTSISLSGLPEKFESDTNSAQGGFRVTSDIGTLFFDNDTGHFVDGGWTHKESSNQQRIWNLTWLSPSDNTTMSKITIYGNAVNGNQMSNGDNWNVIEVYVPGVENFDPIPNAQIIEHELEFFDKTMLVFGLLALLYICFRMIKD